MLHSYKMCTDDAIIKIKINSTTTNKVSSISKYLQYIYVYGKKYKCAKHNCQKVSKARKASEEIISGLEFLFLPKKAKANSMNTEF